MNITLFHSEMVAESRALLSELGIDTAGSSVFETVYQEHNIKVISKHKLCVEYMPNFSAYPTVVLEKDGIRHAKAIKMFQDILDFETELNTPIVVPEVRKTQYSKLEFLFLFADEWNNIKETAKTDSTVSLIYDSFTLADFINITDPRTIASLTILKDKGLISEEKLSQIIG
jgi:hypothetical protein